ncbi:MAG: nicotinamide-nucleotide adenylyltransferase [Sulfolobales archaeon]|mgnify:CR=1 FL=1
MIKRGVFPGRFQPFHLGHLETVKWSLERVDELIIVIGTAQESHTLVNPFTAGERMVMIKEALKEEKIDLGRIYIVPVPDVLMNAVWVSYVRIFTPDFHYGISRNPLVIRLFRDAGYEVLIPPAFNRETYSSTKIRMLMLANDPSWKERVPKAVARYIEEIKGVERIREVSGVD